MSTTTHEQVLTSLTWTQLCTAVGVNPVTTELHVQGPDGKDIEVLSQAIASARGYVFLTTVS